MSNVLTTNASGQSRTRTGRIVALDLARFLAIVGMMSNHLLAHHAPDAVQTAVTGFPSTLFAVLGGVSAVISTRRYLADDRPLAASLSVAARGFVVALIGLALGFVSPFIAVVLLYYGVSMMIIAALLHLATPVLVTLSVLLAVGTPQLILWARAVRPDPIGELNFTDPLGFAFSVFATGAYPVVTWLVFMLIGICVARVILTASAHRRVIVLAITGGSLAAAGFIADLASRSAVMDALRSSGASPQDIEHIARGLEAGVMGGPVGPGWIAVVNASPHSGSTADILRTTGVAVLVIVVLLLATSRFSERLPLVLRPIAGAGAAPLTIYTLHVLVVSGSLFGALLFQLPDTAYWLLLGPIALLLHVVGALLIGLVLSLKPRRGPLEAFVSAVARRAARVAPGAGFTRTQP
jgi:uncharacterized membrane protein